MKFLYLLSFLVFCNQSIGQIYYVAVSGEGNLTLSENIEEPGDIEYAFSNAPKNSTVYVKKGMYGELNLIVSNDSTTFIGYKDNPNDISSSDMPNSMDTYDHSKLIECFPTIEKNQASGGTGIKVNGNAIRIENFYISKYKSISTRGFRSLCDLVINYTDRIVVFYISNRSFAGQRKIQI